VTVYGTTEAGAEVRVNGVFASDGTADWSATIVLAEGMNTISIVADDALGNSVALVITVEYIPPVYVTPEELAAVQALLQDQLDDLTASLTENVSDLQALVDDLAADLGENVTYLQGQIDSLTASLAADMAQLQMIIDALDDALAENRSALDADVAALQAQISGLAASLTQNVTALQNQITVTQSDMDDLQSDLEDQIADLNQTTQDDIDAVDEKASDTNEFASMLMYLTLALFAIAVILVGVVWYAMNGKVGGGSDGSSPSIEEVEPQPPSEVEKEFEALEREINQDEL